MNVLHRIVVVTDKPALANDLLTWLSAELYRVVTVTTFAAARALLRRDPNLVITQLRLGSYNGLHLALRARCQGIPAIVIGEPDAVLERDAVQLGATYVTADEYGREQILSLVRHLIPSTCVDQRYHDHMAIGGSASAGSMQTRGFG